MEKILYTIYQREFDSDTSNILQTSVVYSPVKFFVISLKEYMNIDGIFGKTIFVNQNKFDTYHSILERENKIAKLLQP